MNEFQLGYFESAESAYSKAINLSPAYAEVYNNRGVLYLELKQYDKAYTDFAQAITLKQNYYEASINRAIVLKERKQFADALEALALIITQDPENITAYNNQGVVLVELKLFDQALTSFTEAIRINKNYVEAYNNRGNVLHRLKRYNDALADFEEAIRIDPDYADAHNNKGNALKELGYFDQALDSYDAALKINSRYFQAYNNKGNVLKDLKLFDEALKNYSKAIEINSEYPPALWNKGLVSLMLGNYQEGWKLYEWRKKTEELKEIFYKLPQPECLETESIKGKRLLIYPEQGFGDFIQFVRYLPVVSSLKVDIILETPPQLFSLMTTIDAPVTLVRKGNPLPDFDAYCPIMSLPFIFKTDINDIPGKVPYLRPDMEKVSKWKAQLGESKKMRIGLVWSGAERHKNDHNRTMKLAQFAPLFELPIEWHSLQKEYRSSDAEQLSLFSFIHQHQNQLVDFSDTAALIECMDLIISVDTSVAHLAGAMNKKVWILIPFIPDFRWMLDRNDSPWYPSATLFRQTKRNDWEGVIKQVRGCLKNHVIERISVIIP